MIMLGFFLIGIVSICLLALLVLASNFIDSQLERIAKYQQSVVGELKLNERPSIEVPFLVVAPKIDEARLFLRLASFLVTLPRNSLSSAVGVVGWLLEYRLFKYFSIRVVGVFLLFAPLGFGGIINNGIEIDALAWAIYFTALPVIGIISLLMVFLLGALSAVLYGFTRLIDGIFLKTALSPCPKLVMGAKKEDISISVRPFQLLRGLAHCLIYEDKRVPILIADWSSETFRGRPQHT